jgi:ABC-type dipeptide/oligopeptide/nickel transport system permease subunit
MKRKFSEKASPGAGKRWRIYLKRGWLELGLGFAVLALLLLGNLVSCAQITSLPQKEGDWPHTPPHWRFLQRLLYQPSDTKTGPVTASDDGFNFDPFTNGSALPDTSPSQFTIISLPAYTAVASEFYRYQVEVSESPANLKFQLRNAPPGMQIDNESGAVQWTPSTDQVGKHRVEIVAFDGQHRSVMQEYSVYVAKRSHPFGTDARGRNLIAALALGSQWTLLPGLIAVAVATIFGTILGGLGGYHGGRIDSVLSYISGLWEAFPALVLIFLAAAIFHFNIYPVMAVVGLVRSPIVAKAIKGKVLSLKAQQFVEATKELGLSDHQILWKEIIWHNARPLLLTQISYGFAFAILVEVTLSYLNFGVQIPLVSWGNMLSEGRTRLYDELWLFFFPVVAIVLTVIGFYLLGDGVNRVYKIKGE